MCGLAVFTAATTFGQKFEVVSIKPNDSNAGEGDRVGAGGFGATNISLLALIARAYGLPQGQIIGPAWLDAVRFDVIARVPGGGSIGRRRIVRTFRRCSGTCSPSASK